MTEMAGIEYIQDPLPGMRMIPKDHPPEEEGQPLFLTCLEDGCPHVWEDCWKESRDL
jgi:hypothetical protein